LTFSDFVLKYEDGNLVDHNVGGTLSKGFFTNLFFGYSIAKKFLDNIKKAQTVVRNDFKEQDDIISVMIHEEFPNKEHNMTIKVIRIENYDGI